MCWREPILWVVIMMVVINGMIIIKLVIMFIVNIYFNELVIFNFEIVI